MRENRALYHGVGLTPTCYAHVRQQGKVFDILLG